MRARRAGRGARRRAVLCVTVGLLAACFIDQPATGAPLASAGSGRVVLQSPPTPGAVTSDVLDVTTDTGKVSAFQSANLSELAAASGVAGNLSVATAASGAVEVAGRTASGLLLLFTSAPRAAFGSAKSWSVADLTTLASAPQAAGDPSVIVDQSGVIRVFYRTGTGQLEEVENDRHTAEDPWFSSDLTSLTATTASLTIAGNPVALSAPGYPVEVFARAGNGDLLGYTLTSIALHPWYYENVTELALGPPIIGMPAVAPAPDGLGLTAVYAVTPGDQLVEFTDDDAGWHTWSVRDVSSALRLPPVASSPSVLDGDPLDVATASVAGHAIVVSLPSVTLAGASVQDVSAMADQRVEPMSDVSIARGSPGYVLAAVTTSKHREVFSVASAAASTATVADATMQPFTEQLVGDFPSAIRADGTLQVFARSAGFVGVAARIVLDASSQDQFHAGVVDTPWNTNCNPYTAVFGRGTTAGCVPGTASEEWCSDFADWVWTEAGVATTGIDGASSSFVTWGEARNQFLKGMHSTPAVGDAVVWGVLDPLWGAHVGIVVGVHDGEIDVVAGNAGGGRTSGVVDSGWFAPASMLAQGDPIIGYVSPTPLPSP